MNYWLHRITGGDYAYSLSSELFKKGYISIGWCDFARGGEADLARLRAGVGNFDKRMEEEGYGHPRNRWNLWRFVNEMKPGDLVIVPFPYSFSVCKIKDEAIYTPASMAPSLLVDSDGNKVLLGEDGYLRDKDGNIVDLGFFRKVELVEKSIPRDKYADQALYSRMKIRQTNACIDDIAGSIRNAILAFRDNKPVDLKESILESTVQTVLDQIRNLLNDTKFETLVEYYLKSIGANRVETPWKGESPSGEGDADRVAYFDQLGFAIMVQVKKHFDKTDDWAVSQIKAYGKNHHFGEYATSLWVISSADGFSEEAVKLAAEENIRLIDGPRFARMILEAGLFGLKP